MMQKGWYCCTDCGRRLIKINAAGAVKGVQIRCIGKKDRRRGHINGWVRAVRVYPRVNRDRAVLQAFLEDAHMAMNRGECQTYNICRYCAEPESACREAATPCADAFLRMYQQTRRSLVFRARSRRWTPKLGVARL